MSVGGRGVFSAAYEGHLFEVARMPDPSRDADATLAAAGA